MTQAAEVNDIIQDPGSKITSQLHLRDRDVMRPCVTLRRCDTVCCVNVAAAMR